MAFNFFNKEKRAVEQYKKTAEQGDAEAQYNLGWCYSNGFGVEKIWKTRYIVTQKQQNRERQ
jgi:TPR repeat protein